ncbi:MAG TPA: hypothetical protein VIA18_15340, partial [Polyangia bacterium]|nr:hypothetical protein [Polyangia bacterium]
MTTIPRALTRCSGLLGLCLLALPACKSSDRAATTDASADHDSGVVNDGDGFNPPPSSDGGTADMAGPHAGATTPFTSWEAEAGTLGGSAQTVALTTPPTTQYSSPELESSGHAYVALTKTGDYVEWTNDTGQPITFINVRASIPDAAA